MSINTPNQALLPTILQILTATKHKMNIEFSNTTTQIHAIFLIFLFIISMVLAPWGTTYAADTAGKKWNPGHYYGIMTSRKNDPDYLARVYNELDETPTLRGLYIRYRWAELEPTKWDYDFTSIDQRLAELTAKGKRLIIAVETKSFDPEVVLVPDYVKTEKYDGGIFAYHSHGDSADEINGYNVKLWNNNVRYRLTKLAEALGEHYNAHPNFEAIGLLETAMGQPIEAIADYQVDKFYENLMNVNIAMSTHFPNTMTFQNLNFPHHIIESFVSQLREMGSALAVPDVRPGDPILGRDEPDRPKGIYTYYPTHSGIMPLMLQVEHNNYINTRRDGSGHEPTIPELLRFARHDLKTNYLVWARISSKYDEVLQVMNWDNQTRDAAGGLDQTCPTVYSLCINNDEATQN